MTSYEIVGLYVAINLFLHFFLMIQVGSQRGKSKVGLGDGGDATLLGKIRAQGNYTENAPIVFISLIIMAMLGAAGLALHIFGAVFTIGRLFHNHGMTREGSSGKGRAIGAISTVLVILASALYILYLVFMGPTGH